MPWARILFWLLGLMLLVSQIPAQEGLRSLMPGQGIVLRIFDAGYHGVEARIKDRNGRSLVVSPAYLQAHEGRSEWLAFMGIPNTIEADYYGAELSFFQQDGRKSRRIILIKVEEKAFAEEVIHLDARLTEVRESNPQQRALESMSLTRVLETPNLEAWHWTGTFQAPLESLRVTDSYGSRRRFLYSDGRRDLSVHQGVDYGAARGTRVLAPADGRVVFAGFRQVSGNTLVLEHLPGVFTLYYHLDSIGLELGDLARQGDLLGTVGSTGLATGPHLHWEMRIGYESVDPEYYYQRPLLDRARALNYSVVTF